MSKSELAQYQINAWFKWAIKFPPVWLANQPRWSAVAKMCGCGWEIARELCKWAEVDPNEKKKVRFL